MIKNYFKTAWRNLLNNRVYSLINITGLVVGLSACLLVATVVVDELSYDKQWTHANQLYRLISINNLNNAIERTPNSFSALSPELKQNFPEVKEYCRMQVEQKQLKFHPDKEGVLIQSLSAESSIWQMLDFSILQGNPKTIIEGLDNVVITKQIKDEYFPGSDPVGKIIYDVSNNSSQKCIITGVIKNIPENTHLRAQVLVLRAFLRGIKPNYNKLENGFGISLMPQYLLLSPQTDRSGFVRKINNWYKKQSKEIAGHRSLDLQPFTDVYLRSDYNEPAGIHGSIRTIYAFTGIAILLLLIACINYINLTTARALKKIHETGIQKILGAGRAQLITRFLFESLLFFLISFALSNLVYTVSIQSLESFLGHKLELTLFNSSGLFAFAFGTLLVVCLFTGLYPAYILSGFKPVNTIRGNLTEQVGGTVLKKALITAQFTISIAVLLAAVTVHLQLHFLNNKDLGYDKHNLLQVDFTKWGITGEAFKKEVLKIPGVEKSCIALWYPSFGPGFMGYDTKDPKNENNKIHVSFIDGDLDFAATLKLQLYSGRLFNPSLVTDGMKDTLGYRKVLISETFSKTFNIKDLNKPVEAFLEIPIGIIKNFHNETLLEKEKPFIITARSDIDYGAMLIRIYPGSEKQVITGLQQRWKKFYPEKTLTFNWVEDLLEKQYMAESKLNTLFTFFTVLTVFLACLGLFGLVTFTVEQRTKEIGIRKVLGAPVIVILTLISKDFLKLVLAAIVIASPIAWYLLNKWLQDYAYRIEMQWWMFASAAAMVVLVAILTISFQAIKAAMANPVKSLRTE
jgi:putative ABC transport system permease protein